MTAKQGTALGIVLGVAALVGLAVLVVVLSSGAEYTPAGLNASADRLKGRFVRVRGTVADTALNVRPDGFCLCHVTLSDGRASVQATLSGNRPADFPALGQLVLIGGTVEGRVVDEDGPRICLTTAVQLRD
jgi:cytochrome c-type biogenesis protein CcmE